MDYVFNLTATDMSHLGGPMGTEYTSIMYVKTFGTLEKAQKYAQKDYKYSDIGLALKWKKDGRNAWTSGDLGWVEYTINKVKVL